MGLREQFTERLKTAMKSGDTAGTSTMRMILARLKDVDIAARPKGIDKVPDEEVLTALRGMVKQRRESADLYRQGNRPDLVAKEETEIAVIESFLPPELDPAATERAVAEAITETGASGMKDMGKVMAALRARHGVALDMARVAPMVRAKLAG